MKQLKLVLIFVICLSLPYLSTLKRLNKGVDNNSVQVQSPGNINKNSPIYKYMVTNKNYNKGFLQIDQDLTSINLSQTINNNYDFLIGKNDQQEIYPTNMAWSTIANEFSTTDFAATEKRELMREFLK